MSLIKDLNLLINDLEGHEDGRVSASFTSTDESAQEASPSLWGWDTPDGWTDGGTSMVEMLPLSTDCESAGENADIGTTHPLTGERYEDDAEPDCSVPSRFNLRVTCHGTELPRCKECICIGGAI